VFQRRKIQSRRLSRFLRQHIFHKFINKQDLDFVFFSFVIRLMSSFQTVLNRVHPPTLFVYVLKRSLNEYNQADCIVFIEHVINTKMEISYFICQNESWVSR